MYWLSYDAVHYGRDIKEAFQLLRHNNSQGLLPIFARLEENYVLGCGRMTPQFSMEMWNLYKPVVPGHKYYESC